MRKVSKGEKEAAEFGVHLFWGQAGKDWVLSMQLGDNLIQSILGQCLPPCSLFLPFPSTLLFLPLGSCPWFHIWMWFQHPEGQLGSLNMWAGSGVRPKVSSDLPEFSPRGLLNTYKHLSEATSRLPSVPSQEIKQLPKAYLGVIDICSLLLLLPTPSLSHCLLVPRKAVSWGVCRQRLYPLVSSASPSSATNDSQTYHSGYASKSKLKTNKQKLHCAPMPGVIAFSNSHPINTGAFLAKLVALGSKGANEVQELIEKWFSDNHDIVTHEILGKTRHS